MRRNVLITGGAGFIGSHLASALLAEGFGVTVLDNLTPQVHGGAASKNGIKPSALPPEVNFVFGSVNQPEHLAKAISGVDTVVHLAAETGTGQSMYEVSKYVTTNIGGTAVLLDFLTSEQHSVKKVVVASSRSIYGEGKYHSPAHGVVYPEHRSDTQMASGLFEVQHPEDGSPLTAVPTDEDSLIHPSSVYGITKQSQESLVMTVCPPLNIAPVALRLQNVYGPGQSLSNPYTGILSIFSTLIQNNEPINVFEDGFESRDFVYIDDVIAAFVSSIVTEEANGRVLNVGSGVATTVNEVVAALQESYNHKVPVTISGNYRLGDIRHNFADLTAIEKVLGYKPATSLKDGIKNFAEWVVQQDVAVSHYEKSLEEMREKKLLK